VFSRPEIKQLLDQYVIVQLYTDKVPPKVQQPATSATENRALLEERFETFELPHYVILRPDGKDGAPVDTYHVGKINDVESFAEFLRKPLATSVTGSGTQVGMR
jgi:hypothetical protein